MKKPMLITGPLASVVVSGPSLRAGNHEFFVRVWFNLYVIVSLALTEQKKIK